MKTRIFTIMGLLLITTLEVAAQNVDKLFYLQNGQQNKQFFIQEDQRADRDVIFSSNHLLTADTIITFDNESNHTENCKSFDTLYCISDMPLFDFKIFNENQALDLFSDAVRRINDSTLSILLNAGTFDVFLFSKDENYYSYVIIREQLNINNNDTLYFHQSEAKHRLVFKAFDENNEPFSELAGEKWLHMSVNFPDKMADRYFYASLFKYDTIYCSDASPSYTIYVGNSLKRPGNGKLYFPVFEPLYGVDQSHTIINDPADYITQDVEFVLPDTVPDIKYVVVDAHKNINARGVWSGGGTGNENDLSGNIFKSKLFLSGEQLDDAGYHFSFYFHDRSREHILSSQGFSVYQNKIINSTFNNSPNFVQLQDESSSTIGNGPVSFGTMANFYSNPSYNVLHFYGRPVPMGMYNEYRTISFFKETYKIYNSSWQVLKEGFMKDYYYFTTEEDEIYFEVLNKDFTVARERGKAVNLMHFNFDNEDAIPPEIASLQVKNETGKPHEYVHTADAFKISFTGRDYYIEESGYYFINHYKRISPDSTRLYIKKEENQNWQEITVNNVYEDENIGIYFESEELIFSEDDLGYFDVKIHIVDSVGNSTTLTVEPAFKVVDFYVDVEETQTPETSSVVCYPNPFRDEVQIEYTLAKQQYVEMNIINLQGQTIHTLYSGHQSEGRHQLQWNVPQAIVPGIYYLVMKSEGMVSTRKVVKM